MNNRVCLFLVLLALTLACNPRKSSEEVTHGAEVGSEEEEIHRFEEKTYKDSILLGLTKEILGIVKDKDYKELAHYVHPQVGLRFSPYGYIDTLSHLHFTKEEFIKEAEGDHRVVWGSFDGTGKNIRMTLDEYFDRFVYDKDFLNAQQVSVNEVLGKGNSLINTNEIFPRADFTESYFPGFEEKYGGMDWRSLRLVFQRQGDGIYLVAIVHDEWTV